MSREVSDEVSTGTVCAQGGVAVGPDGVDVEADLSVVGCRCQVDQIPECVGVCRGGAGEDHLGRRGLTGELEQGGFQRGNGLQVVAVERKFAEGDRCAGGHCAPDASGVARAGAVLDRDRRFGPAVDDRAEPVLTDVQRLAEGDADREPDANLASLRRIGLELTSWPPIPRPGQSTW